MKVRSQHGAAVLAILAMVIIVFTSAFITGVSLNKQQVIQKQVNAIKLGKAKDALLGYALSQSPPGLLPCSDTDGDGESDTAGGSCTAQLGFFPYKTLKLDALRDTSGSFLWYAPELSYTEVSGSLNASSDSSLRFNTSVVVAAVILAPGSVVGSQVRTNNNVIQYLEGINSDGNTLTYEVNKSDTNNDEVLPILINDFWSTMERYVLRNAADALGAYRDTLGCDEYPWAAGTSAPYDSQASLEFGKLPIGTTIASGGAVGCPTALAVAPWFDPHWVDEIRYAFCGSSGSDCLTLNGDLNQTGNGLLLAPGYSLAGQMRPSATLSDYFEDDNNDADLNFFYRAQRNHDDVFNDTIHLFDP